MKHPVPKHKKSRGRSNRRYAAFARSARAKILNRVLPQLHGSKTYEPSEEEVKRKERKITKVKA